MKLKIYPFIDKPLTEIGSLQILSHIAGGDIHFEPNMVKVEGLRNWSEAYLIYRIGWLAGIWTQCDRVVVLVLY